MSGTKQHKFSFLAVYQKKYLWAAQNTLYYLWASWYRNISLYGYHLFRVVALLDKCNHSFGPFSTATLSSMVYTKQCSQKAIVPTPPSTLTLREPPSRELRSATCSSSIEIRATGNAALDNAFSIDHTIKEIIYSDDNQEEKYDENRDDGNKDKDREDNRDEEGGNHEDKDKDRGDDKMRMMTPKTTMMTMTNSTKVLCLMTMMTTQLATQSIMFHWQRGLVQASSQRLVVQINPTLMVCQNKRQRRCWVSGRRAGRKKGIKIEGRVHVGRRLMIP
jgi:hypothetical protein